MNLNGGALFGNEATRVISELGLRDVHVPSMAQRSLGAQDAALREFLQRLAGTGLGLGWINTMYYGEHFRLTHNGQTFGFETLVSVLPDDEFGLVLLTNVFPGTPKHEYVKEVIAGFVLDTVLGLPLQTPTVADGCTWPCSVPRLHSLPMCPKNDDAAELRSEKLASIERAMSHAGPFVRPTAAVTVARKPAVPTVSSEYDPSLLGDYRHPVDGTMRVTVLGDALFATMQDYFAGMLVPGASDTYQWDGQIVGLPHNSQVNPTMALQAVRNRAGSVVKLRFTYTGDGVAYAIPFVAASYDAATDGAMGCTFAHDDGVVEVFVDNSNNGGGGGQQPQQ
jgi:hypothetical protein